MAAGRDDDDKIPASYLPLYPAIILDSVVDSAPLDAVRLSRVSAAVSAPSPGTRARQRHLRRQAAMQPAPRWRPTRVQPRAEIPGAVSVLPPRQFASGCTSGCATAARRSRCIQPGTVIRLPGRTRGRRFYCFVSSLNSIYWPRSPSFRTALCNGPATSISPLSVTPEPPLRGGLPGRAPVARGVSSSVYGNRVHGGRADLGCLLTFGLSGADLKSQGRKMPVGRHWRD